MSKIWDTRNMTYIWTLQQMKIYKNTLRFAWVHISTHNVGYQCRLLRNLLERSKNGWIRNIRGIFENFKNIKKWRILRSSNHTSYSQMQMKACFPTADQQRGMAENVAILYIRMGKKLFKTAETKPISRDVNFGFIFSLSEEYVWCLRDDLITSWRKRWNDFWRGNFIWLTWKIQQKKLEREKLNDWRWMWMVSRLKQSKNGKVRSFLLKRIDKTGSEHRWKTLWITWANGRSQDKRRILLWRVFTCRDCKILLGWIIFFKFFFFHFW